MNKMNRMKMEILFSESVLNPVHPVHPVRLFLVAAAALGLCASIPTRSVVTHRGRFIPWSAQHEEICPAVAPILSFFALLDLCGNPHLPPSSIS
ncbi:MAG: hypothetical protein ABSH38_13295 [Verrucomicrobiota bacterium]